MRTCVDVSGRGLEGIFVCVSEEGVCLLMSTCGFVYLCVYVCVSQMGMTAGQGMDIWPCGMKPKCQYG